MAMDATDGQRVEPAVMITGAAGFVGRRLIQALASEKETVVALYHHRLPESLDHSYPVCSDMSSAELMAAPLRGVDSVVHLAWDGGLSGPLNRLDWSAMTAATASRNTQMLANLITAMERAGTRRIVFLSAIGASKEAVSPFLQDKYAGEFLVLNSKIPEKVIIRSSVIWSGNGTDDPFLRSILKVMKYPIYPVPQRREELAPMHVDDLAALLAKACRQTCAAGSTLMEIDGGERFAVDELFKLISTNVTRKTKLALGGFLGRSLLPFFERDSARTSKTSVVPRLQHYLALGSRAKGATTEAPMQNLVPEKMASFRDRLAAGTTMPTH